MVARPPSRAGHWSTAVDSSLGHVLLRLESFFVNASVISPLAHAASRDPIPVPRTERPVAPRRTAAARQLPAVALALVGTLGFAGGCRGRAQDEIYRQKLTGEIRNLEDQLYEADYENRVLAQRLQRLEQDLRRLRETPEETRAAEPRRSRTLEPRPLEPGTPPESTRGRPTPPPGPTPAAPPSRQPSPEWELDLDDIEIDEGLPEFGREGNRESRLEPAPGGPEPPGPRDLRIPPIEPGEVVPPPSGDAEPESLPGKIELDETMRFLGAARVLGAAGGRPDGPHRGGGDASRGEEPRAPVQIRLHPTLSGPLRSIGLPGSPKASDGDDVEDAGGIELVIQAVDRGGRVVDLDGFDIDAELSVVALDPLRDPSEARIARWDFAPEDVARLVRDRPISGLYLTLAWQDERPRGDEVRVHVRLRSPRDHEWKDLNVPGHDTAGQELAEGTVDPGGLATDRSPVTLVGREVAEDESDEMLACEGIIRLAGGRPAARWTPRR